MLSVTTATCAHGARQPTPLTSRRLATVLVTGATGFIGSHVARLLARARRRGGARPSRAARPTTAIADLDLKRVKLRRARPARACGARCAGSSGCSTAPGVTSVRPEDAERLFDVNVRGTEARDGGVPARGGRARGLHLERRRGRPGRRTARPPTRRSSSPAGELGIPYVSSVHEAEVEAMRRGRARAAARVREPGRLLRRRRPPAHLDPAGALVPARPHPGLHRRRDLRRRRARRRRGPPARRPARRRSASATSSAGATSPSTGCSPTSAGSRASTRRCGCRAAARAAAGLLASAGRSWPLTPRRGARRQPLVDLPLHQGAGASWAGARARTRRRSRRRSPGTSSASTTGSRAPAARSSSSSALAGAAIGVAESAVGAAAARGRASLALAG